MDVENTSDPLDVVFFYDNMISAKEKLKIPRTTESKPKVSKTVEVRSRLDIDGKDVSVIFDFNVDVKSSSFNRNKKSSSKYKSSEYESYEYGSGKKNRNDRTPKRKGRRSDLDSVDDYDLDDTRDNRKRNGRNRKSPGRDYDDDDFDSMSRDGDRRKGKRRRSKDRRRPGKGRNNNDDGFGS